jgi:hypothetical protein
VARGASLPPTAPTYRNARCSTKAPPSPRWRQDPDPRAALGRTRNELARASTTATTSTPTTASPSAPSTSSAVCLRGEGLDDGDDGAALDTHDDLSIGTLGKLHPDGDELHPHTLDDGAALDTADELSPDTFDELHRRRPRPRQPLPRWPLPRRAPQLAGGERSPDTFDDLSLNDLR